MSIMGRVEAKICGLKEPQHVLDALTYGAAFVGFVTFPNSPRHILPSDARPLAALAMGGAQTVSVLVDPDDALIEQVLTDLAPDFLQLQGGESPERCAHLRARGVGIIRAIGVAEPADLDKVKPYAGCVDYFLFDAKAPKDANRPGGLGQPFDWDILQGYRAEVPWFLSGGLSPDNVAEAVARTGARLVDVSSGVERAPGLKDSGRIKRFLDALPAH